MGHIFYFSFKYVPFRISFHFQNVLACLLYKSFQFTLLSFGGWLLRFVEYPGENLMSSLCPSGNSSRSAGYSSKKIQLTHS